MQLTGKLIYALLTAMTLSLAGCGGSSSKTAGTEPEPTELENLQTAAKTAATGAETAATGANTAVADVIPLQTTGMEDGYHKAESLVQKDKAMAESVKAKEASDNAAKATTVAAAKTAKDAAEAARTAAETARDAAVKAAMMDVKYSGGMYKLGDQSITSGAPRKETTTTLTDGTTQTRYTGTLREFKISAHTAKSSSSSSQPAIEAQPLPVGRRTDSSDDTARLKLMDKYIREKTANMFVERPIDAATDTSTDITDEEPHGTLTDINGATVKVERATGEFYFARDTGPYFSPTDVSSETIPARQTDQNKREITGFYYFIAPSDGIINGKNYKKGEKVWLRRFGSETKFTATKIKYQFVSVAENIKFPVVEAYQHMNYGTWAALKDEEGDKDNTTPADLNDVTAFVRSLQDNNMTPVTDMPKTGTATWHGHWVGNARAAHAEGTGAITDVSGGSKMTATFGTAMTIKVELMKDDTDMFATLNGKIMGNRFKDAGSATNEVTVNNSVGEVKAGGKFTGSFSGAFFGPDAVETGGVFDYTSEGGKDGQFKGAFGGRKI